MTYANRIPFHALLACGFAGVLACGLAAEARADDPGDEGFPPAVEREEAPAKTTEGGNDMPPPARTRETPPAGWSPPATTPGRPTRVTKTDSSLPPPRIVRRRSGAMPRATPPVRQAPPPADRPAPTRPTAETRTPVTRTPITRTPETRTPITRTPETRTPVTRTPIERAPEVGPAAGAAGVAGSRVFGITKVHNVPLDRPGMTREELALQLDIDYEVREQAGRDVYVAVWFARVDDGSLITAAMPTYRDRRGHAMLQTRSARVGQPVARYKATVRMPYRAFPMAAGESSYEVEARVQVLRSEPNGEVTLLCRGATTFRVYGFAEGEAPEARELPGEENVGTSIAGETGRIEDPGR